MALIAMAVHDTEENGRSWMTKATLKSMVENIPAQGNRIFIIDNGSCEETKEILREFDSDYFVDVRGYDITIITNPENAGTAAAINQAWQHRRPGEHAVKMDNDVTFGQNAKNWPAQLEEAIARDPEIGIVGLKRKDCIEHPNHENEFYRSKLYHLPHQPGECWIVGEQVHHVMGTCQMYSAALLDKIGYLYQPRLYGFDDVLAAARCMAAGFKNVFLPHIEIDHIDPGGTDYTHWKQRHAGEDFRAMMVLRDQITRGEKPYYYNPYEPESSNVY